MRVYVHSQCLMSTFQYLLWSSCSRSVSSCPYKKSFCWYKSAKVWKACTLWMSLQPRPKSSKSLLSNRWKAVLVLSSLKTYNISFGYFIVSVSSGPLWLFKISWKTVRLASQSFSISVTAPIVSNTSTESDWRCGTERVWLVRLSQKFVRMSKSRCISSMNWWYNVHKLILNTVDACAWFGLKKMPVKEWIYYCGLNSLKL